MKVAATVGIRELKDRAADLVRRAASGEAIVVTRHGKPRAVLLPATVVEDASLSPRHSQWARERRAFEALGPAARKRYDGRWVAVHGGRVVDSDRVLDRLSARAARNLEGRTFYIGRVGHPLELVELPGFEVE